MKSDQPTFLQVVRINADSGFQKLATLLEQTLDIFADEIGFEIDGVIHLLGTRRRHFWICALRQHAAEYASRFLAQSYAWQLAGQTPPGVRSRDPTTFPNTG